MDYTDVKVEMLRPNWILRAMVTTNITRKRFNFHPFYFYFSDILSLKSLMKLFLFPRISLRHQEHATLLRQKGGTRIKQKPQLAGVGLVFKMQKRTVS